MKTRLLSAISPKEAASAIEEAATLLAEGEIAALPTETVYGLAGDATRPDAVLKIFEAKERPFFDPLICHLPSREWLQRMTRVPDESAALVDALISRFWPGALTLVLPRSEEVPDIITSGLETVAVRMSAHPVFSAICERFGRPLAAPSANRFGRISPTQASHVVSELDGRIPLIVDGGTSLHGIESTIVAVRRREIRVLRPGPITEAELSSACAAAGGSMGKPGGSREDDPSRAAMTAPGSLPSHYAPRTPLQFLDSQSTYDNPRRIGVLAFHSCSAQPFAQTEILSHTGDFREAAATLFAKLRKLDDAGLDLLLAERLPEQGLGIAIMDRLRKAAGQG